MSRELQVAHLEAVLLVVECNAVKHDTSAFGDVVGDVVQILQPRVERMPLGKRVSGDRVNEGRFGGGAVGLVGDPADRASAGHVALDEPLVDCLDINAADLAPQLRHVHILPGREGQRVSRLKQGYA